MPSSRPHTLNIIGTYIINKQPQKALDIGIGFGKYGFMLREFTDAWNGNYHHWKTIIEGIEIHEKYILAHHHNIYNKIHIGDAVSTLSNLPNDYDMIICGDMLEHLTENEGHMLLSLISHHSKFAMITTPKKMGKQGSVYGNIHETHKHEWDIKSLSKYGKVSEHENTLLLVINNDSV